MKSELIAMIVENPGTVLNGLLRSDGATVADYRAGVGLTDDGAGLCSAWANQIGAAPSLTATLTRRPTIQADGSLLFNGSSNLLKTSAFTLNQPTTIYIVYRAVTWVLNQYIFDGNLATTGALYFAGTTPTIAISAGTPTAGNTNHGLGVDRINTVVFNGAASSLQVDETTPTTGNAGAANMGGLTLGGAGNTSSFSNIQVQRLVVRNVADPLAMQIRVRQLLRQVYNTPN